MIANFGRYWHPAERFALRIPRDWYRVKDLHDIRDGVALVMVEPDRGTGFRANVVVTAERVPAGTDLVSWHDQQLTLLPGGLAEFVLLDLEELALGGIPARRVLGHHSAEGRAVTMEQWATVDRGRGYTLTASVGTLDYDEQADLFTTIAHSFRLEAEEHD